MNFEKFRNIINLSPIRRKLASKLTALEVSEGENFYLMFLFLMYKYKNVPIVPTTLIDEFWHAHILDTVKYMDDCEALYGCYIHHFPYLGQRGQKDAQKLQDQFDISMKLFESEFNVNPSKSEKLSGSSICAGSCGSRRITAIENISGLDLHTRGCSVGHL